MQAIIFDFNGTMLFDLPKHDMAWQIFLADLIGRTISDEEMSAYVYGRNNLFSLEHFIGRSMTPDEAYRMGEEKERIYRELLDTFSFYHVPMTIAMMAGKTNLEMYYKYLDLGKWFRWDDIVYDDRSLPGKPDPTVYRRAMEKINVAPEDCIIFEDSISGIQSAYAAGAGTIIAVADTENSKRLETLPGVKHVIRDYSNILTKLPFLKFTYY